MVNSTCGNDTCFEFFQKGFPRGNITKTTLASLRFFYHQTVGIDIVILIYKSLYCIKKKLKKRWTLIKALIICDPRSFSWNDWN